MKIYLFFCTMALIGLNRLVAQPVIQAVQPEQGSLMVQGLSEAQATWPLDSLALQIGGEARELLSWEPLDPGQGIKLLLVVGGQDDTQLNHVRERAVSLLQALEPGRDSAMLVFTGRSLNNTDLNDNFQALSLILARAEAEPTHRLYDAAASALEAARAMQGRRLLLLMGPDQDQGSNLARDTLMQHAWRAGVPCYHWSPQNGQSRALRALSDTTGGAGLPRDWRPDSLLAAWRQVQRLSFSPVAAPGPVSVRLRLGSQVLRYGPDLSEPPGSLEAPAFAVRSWWWMLGIFLLLGAVATWGLLYLRKQRNRRSVIAPTITALEVMAAKDRLKVHFNLPRGRIPARISVQTKGGRPVRDQVVAAQRSQVYFDLEGLPQGLYVCYISHAGMKSDEWEFFWEK